MFVTNSNRENNVIIRREEEKDRDTVYKLVKEAFDSAEEKDGNEQDLVVALRNGESFVPELSLVAEQDGRIIGHILFTEAKVGDYTVLTLAPLSVLPSYQKTGIGTALMNEGHRVANKLGYKYSVVLGSDKYYPRVGYAPADELGILPPFEVPRELFMAIKLSEDAPSVNGVLRYAKEFGIN